MLGFAFGLALAVRCGAASTTTATVGGLVGADAIHHFLASSLGSSLHDIAARRLACTAPQSLATHGDGFSHFAFFGAKAFNQRHWNLLLGKAFNVHHEAFFIHADQAHGIAFATCAASTADAVHVVFRDVRNLVVDHVGQFVDVDATCCNISSYQRTQFAGLEAFEGLSTGALALVAVQGHGRDAILGQVLGNVVGAKLGAGENQHLAPVVFLNDVQQNLLLLAATHGVDHLLDALHCRVAGRNLNGLRVAQQAVGQITDFIAESGREQQALLVLGHQCQHLLDVVDKAHVQHAVGFVQNQHLDSRQVHETLACQIQQTAGSGDQNVHAFFDTGNLWLHANATEDDCGIDIHVFGVAAQVFFNLSGQLAGGSQHQRANALAAKSILGRCASCQALQHG